MSGDELTNERIEIVLASLDRITNALERIATALESKPVVEPPVEAPVEPPGSVIESQMRRSSAVIEAERGLAPKYLADRCKCGHVAKHHYPWSVHPCQHCECEAFDRP